MIVELRVENLAIIKQVEVHFLGGFSVMTGETGAGKSLLIDALELALGERADTELVRTGSAKASVQLVADLSDSPAIREWCSAESIELEENRMDCISASLDHVYDLTAINELLELVILERNKEALQQKISQLQNQ